MRRWPPVRHRNLASAPNIAGNAISIDICPSGDGHTGATYGRTAVRRDGGDRWGRRRIGELIGGAGCGQSARSSHHFRAHVPVPGGEVAVMDVALLTITDVAGAFLKETTIGSRRVG